MANLFTYSVFFFAILLNSPALSVPLKLDFYQKSCPSAEAIVKSTVTKAFVNDSGIAAAFLIRLHFHDCFVRGCDASILLDSKPGKKAEKESTVNQGVQGFEVIDEAKDKIEAQCPQTVSCADIIAFAARDSVFNAGGIHYDVPGGRFDGRVSLKDEVIKNIPDPFFNATQIEKNFAQKGLSLEEMVTLSGAHSIGGSHCSFFSKRLYSFNATYAQDPSMNPAYAKFLKSQCPKGPKTSKNIMRDPLVHFDTSTPTRLNNNYYKNLKSYKGLLATDQVLWTSSLTRNMVKKNVKHPSSWASKFAAAMVHMGSIDVLSEKQGEIRKNCRMVN